MSNGLAMRLLVLSDLHANTTVPDGGGAASLSFHGSAQGVDRMFGGIAPALAAAGVEDIDAVVVPGDLTDKCDPTALAGVWARLCGLSDELGAELLATAGNHDLQSRAADGSQPNSHLMALEPHFPIRDKLSHANYFAYHFVRTSVGEHTAVVLNSAALGGYSGPEGDEFRHGRVTADGMKRLRTELNDAPSSGVRLLVVHHHPVQLPNIDLNEKSAIRDAELLLEVMQDDGPWLVIHGHKHRPFIHYAPGGGGSAVLFSAGSFSAGLDGVLAQSTKNQFYVIDVLDDEASDAMGLGASGTFRAWSYSPMVGQAWVPSGVTDGLPARGGFGWRTDPTHLARRLIQFARDRNTDTSWEELTAFEPRLVHLAPADFDRVVHRLRRPAELLDVRIDSEGALDRIGLMTEVAGQHV
ncbi:hypothetical protein GCM10023350_02440 [Nocardioides endophyticus]|uniref:Metallophosphoesterase n=1 Tax=Nocardioides endophyticus TaxID=1353775 RepID=A0ABP8YA62_9ACTN